jgi:leucyl aminopeptidase
MGVDSSVRAHFVDRGGAAAIRVIPVTEKELPRLLEQKLGKQAAAGKPWLALNEFRGKPGTVAWLPDARGRPGLVLLGVEGDRDIWSYAALRQALPVGVYRLDSELSPEAATRAALGWALAGYAFTRYKKNEKKRPHLEWPKAADRAAVGRATESIFLVRDLINTPAGDMGPAELADAAKAVARAHGAKFNVVVGEQLLRQNFPAVHAVGRASSRAPRLIDIAWGTGGPLIALIGKGVCFDSGGLDLKPANGMLLMKKDMGGGAHVLALAQMIMAARLPVRLRVLVPAVENSVSGDAYRPLDVLQTRKGLTVEVGNTDAEGRLILSDALAEASSEKPALMIDFATLTGAARVALGTELPAMFCNDDATADALLRHGLAEDDPLWRMPLHKGYRSQLDSPVADLNNVTEGGYAGAITAALFLQEFVEPGIPWVHIDLMAWNVANRPGRPKGGEAMALRAVYALIAEKAAASRSAAKGKTR